MPSHRTAADDAVQDAVFEHNAHSDYRRNLPGSVAVWCFADGDGMARRAALDVLCSVRDHIEEQEPSQDALDALAWVAAAYGALDAGYDTIEAWTGAGDDAEAALGYADAEAEIAAPDAQRALQQAAYDAYVAAAQALVEVMGAPTQQQADWFHEQTQEEIADCQRGHALVYSESECAAWMFESLDDAEADNAE